ncbi:MULTISPECIES: Yip1 family protein [unclassified Rhodanobacter]|uniref:Yip1 family protein n=1 Tax=unclassified Rhodanobacter TaxID=2621553 RepID=UPI001BDF0C4F|nr:MULTISPECIES: Yip1 family protein [unclassified Rhodanobacter]MBT2144441.1 YIP1 family protein [Rhodanobacter sp. LX-99]MBT2149892.1 YIP1 family protein [Rhodanobacter sp. LX-100]
MDFGKIIERIKAILTTPRTEWPAAAAEPATVQSLYAGYIAIVAALPIVAGFIKGSLIGSSAFGITVRTPIGMGIVGMVLHYVLALVIVYVVALIINALAPTFGGQKDMVQALKTVAYAWTASWVAGIAVIVPWLGWLIAIAGGIYSIYLLYLGLPHTMKCPPEKAGGYTAVSVIIAIVLSWIVGAIVVGVVGTAAMTGAAMGGMHVTGSNGESVTIDSDSALGKLAAMGQRAEQASKELDAAQKPGDGQAQSAAMGKMMGAMAGSNGSVEALAPDQIKAFLPDSLGGLKRSSLSAERNSAMGMQISQATANYAADNGQHVTLEVSDTGGAKGFMSLAAAMAPEEEKQTDHGYEKTYSADGNLVHEAWDTQSKYGEYSVVVGKRFTVKANGNVDSIDQLKQAVASIDLGKLESLKDAGVKAN